jgi:hypothetical protein
MWLFGHRLLGGMTVLIMSWWFTEIIFRDPEEDRTQQAYITGAERVIVQTIFWLDIFFWVVAVVLFTYMGLCRPGIMRRQMVHALQAVSPAHVFSPSDDDSKAAEELVCSICLDTVEAGASVRKLSCAHVLHQTCIDDWCRFTTDQPHQSTVCCPVCRHPVVYA